VGVTFSFDRQPFDSGYFYVKTACRYRRLGALNLLHCTRQAQIGFPVPGRSGGAFTEQKGR